MAVKYKYTVDLTEEELNENVVVPCRDDNNYPCILIKNENANRHKQSFSTDNLEFQINNVLQKDGKEYFVHLIKSKRGDISASHSFDVIYNYVFGRITAPISADELMSLVDSLTDYFKQTKDAESAKLCIGVYGELLTARYLYENGIDKIFDYYHRDFFSKHDIEVSPGLRMEIKTRCGEERVHHFDHNQIHRSDVDVIVASVLLEPSDEGLALFDLFSQVIKICDLPDARFFLSKLMIRCGIDEAEKGPSFSEKAALESIKFYDAKSLPQIKSDIPSGITNVTYNVDCSLAESMPLQELKDKINSQYRFFKTLKAPLF